MLNLSYDIISAAVHEIRKCNPITSNSIIALELSRVKTVSLEQERQALENIYKENIKLIFSLTRKVLITTQFCNSLISLEQSRYTHESKEKRTKQSQ